ncbi:MAG: tRNA lysidine(34) synthetase TilS [Candidatus Omnitrophica bacterium]|nr:tRNA lysidine(34) synthetase TilS [Candidatus Omnitrophota bacterium]
MLLDAVSSTISRHRMFRPGDRVLVGVSGGPDSLALFSCLVALRSKFRLSLRALYVDHGLRPRQAAREAACVKRAGRAWGVPVDLARRKVLKEPGESLEAAAREIRYSALTKAAKRRGCRTIALGHTQDDQAETVLMWLLRGSGSAGLAGIPPVREVEGSSLRIVRPLIDCPREEVNGYLRSQGLRACQDASNRSLRFFRNRLRLELIPLLEREYSPQLKRHLGMLARILREEEEVLEKETRRLWRTLARLGRRGLRLDLSQLKKLPPPLRRRVLRLSLKRLRGSLQGFGFQHAELLERLTSDAEGALDLPEGLRAEVRGRWLILTRSATLASKGA